MARMRIVKRRRTANNLGHAPPLVPNNLLPNQANVQEMFKALYSHLKHQFQVNVMGMFKKHLDYETRKRKAAEARVKRKNRLLNRVIEWCNFYCNYNEDLQEWTESMTDVNGEVKEEEVASNFKPDVTPCDMFCRHCRTSMANIVWQPCRHLSTCVSCDAMLQFCPICGCAKMDSFKVNVS